MTLHEINEFLEYAAGLWGAKATLSQEAVTIWGRALERFQPADLHAAAEEVYRTAERINNAQQLLQTLLRQAKALRAGQPMPNSGNLTTSEDADLLRQIAEDDARVDAELASIGADLEFCKAEILRHEPAMVFFKDFPADGRWWRTYIHGRMYCGVFQQQYQVAHAQGRGMPAKWRTEFSTVPIQDYWGSRECQEFRAGPLVAALRGDAA